MRWARSLFPTVVLLSALRTLFAELAASTPAASAPLFRAGGGGSELPWWAPVAVSLAFLSAALLYWWRHRPRRPTDEPGEPEALESAGLEGEDAPSATAPGSDGPGLPPITFGEAIRPAPSA